MRREETEVLKQKKQVGELSNIYNKICLDNNVVNFYLLPTNLLKFTD